MIKQKVGFICIAIVVLFTSGCSNQRSTLSKSNDVFPLRAIQSSNLSNKNSQELYIEVSALSRLDYFKSHKLGMRLAGEALDVLTDYVGPEEYDLDEMKKEFRNAINRKPSGIVVVGFDSSLNAMVNEAAQTGIPVVTVDSDLPGSKRMAFIGTGNHQAGYEGALKLAELIGGVGKIAIMSLPGQPNLDERVQGYMDALRKFPKIEVVAVIDTKSNPLVGKKELEKVLIQHPDLAGIGCVEASGGSGVIKTMKETEKKGQIKIVAMDNDQEVISGIENDIISATVVQQTALMSFYAVQILYNQKHGPFLTNMENTQQHSGTPIMIDTGVVIMDKKNYKKILQNN